MEWINPFNGSKLEVKKTVTESQWDRRADKDDFEEEDVNEYYHLMKHKESKEGFLIRLKISERNPYIK